MIVHILVKFIDHVNQLALRIRGRRALRRCDHAGVSRNLAAVFESLHAVGTTSHDAHRWDRAAILEGEHSGVHERRGNPLILDHAAVLIALGGGAGSRILYGIFGRIGRARAGAIAQYRVAQILGALHQELTQR